MKEKAEIVKNQKQIEIPELKSTMLEIKNSLERSNSSFEQKEERIKTGGRKDQKTCR